MDCRMQAHLKSLVKELAEAHQQELAAAGRLVDLEGLACEIGDELTRELTERELMRRGEENSPEAECPDCGRSCPAGESEPVCPRPRALPLQMPMS